MRKDARRVSEKKGGQGEGEGYQVKRGKGREREKGRNIGSKEGGLPQSQRRSLIYMLCRG